MQYEDENIIVTYQVSDRKPRPKDRSWLYIVSFITLAVLTFDIAQQIEMNHQQPTQIDYN